MKRSPALTALLGFAVTVLGGTLLHFLYGWLGGSLLVAPICAVNESTWEHMKLLFVPSLLFGIPLARLYPSRTDLPCILLRAILVGLVLIPVLFYTYNGAVSPSPDWLNVAFFFLAAAGAYLTEYRLLKSDTPVCRAPGRARLALLALALAFLLFTFLPPPLAIFRDPITSAYGI